MTVARMEKLEKTVEKLSKTLTVGQFAFVALIATHSIAPSITRCSSS